MEELCAFVVEFYTSNEDSPPMRVWSEDLTMVEMFIKQHGFDPTRIRRYVIPGCDKSKHHDKLQPDGELRYMKFRSNSTQDTQQISSSDEIIDTITNSLAGEMVRKLLLGEAITRTDITFLMNIGEIIDSLDYASISDWELINDDLVDRYYMDDDFSILKDEPGPPFPPPSDTSYIYDSLFDACIKNEILPFTIEAYAHYFVKSIMGV